MERIAMSQEERDELDWLKRAAEGSISQREAAQKMSVSDRWVRTLLKRMSKQGDAVVVHGLRGRPSNRKLADETHRQALAILKQPEWHDFGPTFAAEQLAKRHQIQVGKETLRGWMMEAGLWKSKSRRLQEVHGWRPRRSAFGELVQWDTSEHDWLEGRGPVRYLVRMIDDATSWSWGRFVERDATPHNMGVLWEYLEKNGRMVDVYTDRDSMFAVPPRPGESKDEQREADRLTQLGRALRELGIGSILAYSPQAKGRIERSFLTAQDRLVKHLRLAKVSTLEAANAFLENEYWPEWNAHFARPVADFPNHHRALTEQLELAAILCHVEERVIGNDYTFSFAGRRHQIVRQDAQAGMRHQRLRVELRLNGELKARYQGHYVDIAECGAQALSPHPAVRKPVRKDHNAGDKSSWMQGFFDRPSPPLWKAIGE
jgi:transposase